MSQFLSKQNVDVLWDVITDDEVVKTFNPQQMQNLQQFFNRHLRGFNQMYSTKNIIEVNKLYVNYVFQFIYKQAEPKPIQEIQQLVTSQDIQNKRKEDFNKNLKEKQEEFTQSMSSHVPPEVDFRDKLDDEPIKDLELEMKKMMSQRNYEIQNIYSETNPNAQSSWLQAQETSVKKDRLQKPLAASTAPSAGSKAQDPAGPLKTIKIGEELNGVKNKVIELASPLESTPLDFLPNEPAPFGSEPFQKKSISWADQDSNSSSSIEELNFLSKLKTKPIVPRSELDEVKAEIVTLHQKLDTILALLQSSPAGATSIV
jgi:hypothetical protein